ncbi:hypothetical protein CDAR_16291 [Caerostris darwini]|uniref:Uncharacterized protein n=1 Tax=Caerostris darwini TaxID=1538125 RepID=A0AAV4WS12_9ARAC|nr:hypothetical protein CDAR_16291 [Caerostris darwini]
MSPKYSAYNRNAKKEIMPPKESAAPRKRDRSERRRQYIRELYQSVKTAETPEQRERRLERDRARKAENEAAEFSSFLSRCSRVFTLFTQEQRERRLEDFCTRLSKFRAAKTEVQD